MAEEKPQDDSQKTEQPTQRQQEKAREKGQIAQSREVNHFFMISVLLILIWFFGGHIAKSFFRLLKPWVAEVAQRPADGYHLLGNLQEFFLNILVVSGVFFLFFMIAALGAGGLQTRFKVSLEHIKPKGSRLSLMKGIKKIFSPRGLTEFAKGVLKIIVIVGVAYFILSPALTHVDALSGIQTVGILQESQILTSKLLLSIVVVLAVLAAADYTYQWFQTFKEMKMSRQDIKEEYKEQEGDPTSKMRQRQKRREFSQKRANLLQTVPEATVIITNPIHYAVALKWDSQKMKAPLVVAKGSGFVAFRIREIAKENFVPLIENPPLARILHSSLEVNQEILPQHYKAVAEIIRYIMHVDQKKRP